MPLVSESEMTWPAGLNRIGRAPVSRSGLLRVSRGGMRLSLQLLSPAEERRHGSLYEPLQLGSWTREPGRWSCD